MGRKKEEIVIEDSPYVQHSKKHALGISVVEGSAVSIATNVSWSFATPFMLALGGNSFHVGLFSAISGLVDPFGRLKGSKLMEKYSRKKLVLIGKALVILSYFLSIFLIYFFFKNWFVLYLPLILILFLAVLNPFASGVGHVAWFSWMGDLVPAKIRGKYFAKRNRVTGFAGLIAFISAAFLLDFFKTRGYVLFGFSVLFGISILFRLAARYLIGKQFNPQFRVKRGYYFSFLDFVKRYDNYGKFAFFQAVFYFSVMVSSPFFAVYMLEDLGFSYVMFTTVIMSSTFFYLIFVPLAGKFSDKYGNVKLLYVAAILFPLVPVLWIFLKNPIALILLPGLISGIANSAYILGVTNFSYDAAPPQKRGLCLAYTSILIGVGILAGSLLGGVLIQYLPMLFGFVKPIFFVFALSALLMIMTSLFFLPQIKEERGTERMRGLRVDFAHPFETIHSDVVWFKNFIHEK